MGAVNSYALVRSRCPSDCPRLGLGFALHRAANDDNAFVRPGNRPLNEQQIALGINPENCQVLNCDPRVTMMAGHALTLEHAARRGTSTNRARRAPPVRLAVGLLGAAEPVALHAALESASLRGPGHIDFFANSERMDLDLLTDLVNR